MMMQQGGGNIDAQLAAMAKEQGFPSVAAMESFYMSRRRGVQGNALTNPAPTVAPRQQPVPQQRQTQPAQDEGGLMDYILNRWRGATGG